MKQPYPADFIKALAYNVAVSDAPPIELNHDHVQQWESCYFDGAGGDLWLINLFANEYHYLKKCDCKNGCPDCSRTLIDYSC